MDIKHRPEDRLDAIAYLVINADRHKYHLFLSLYTFLFRSFSKFATCHPRIKFRASAELASLAISLWQNVPKDCEF